jgi:hypothetical protein
MRLEDLTTSMKLAVFWNVAQCILVDTRRPSRGTYCLCRHGDE